MNIFLRELKANRKSIILWCIGIILMIAASMGKFAGFSASGQSMNAAVSAMPKSIKVIFGIGDFDLSKAKGFYGMIFSYLALMAAIHAAMLGANIISKEERDKTSEFLMVKPVSRNKIITAKLLSSISNVVIFNIVTLVSSIYMVGYYDKSPNINHDIITLMIGMFILQLLFMLMGTAAASIIRNPKSSTSVSSSILLITYILSMIIDLNSKFQNLKYLTPFKYFEAENLLYNKGFNIITIILSIIIIIILLSVTYIFYGKRDLKA